MIIELHLLQSIVPANLNRDDTGSPKDCVFGGVRRARISSQALKRAARMRFPELLSQRNIQAQNGVRTRRAVDEVAHLLHERYNRDEAEAKELAGAVLHELGIKGEGRDYLLFLGRSALEAFAEHCNELYDSLISGGELSKKSGRKLSQKQEKELKTILLSTKETLDIALFGRMVADLPEGNIDAASQVAHAISTHEVRPEFDYFTAVDDLQPGEETGAGHLDVLEFNSACYYRYASVDTEQLCKNLDGDSQLAATGVEVLLQGLISELPRGKQNSMAAHNPPSLILAMARKRGQCNLANAFEDPVRPDGGYVLPSVRRLLNYYHRLVTAYNYLLPEQAWLVLVESADGINIPSGISKLSKVEDLLSSVGAYVKGNGV